MKTSTYLVIACILFSSWIDSFHGIPLEYNSKQEGTLREARLILPQEDNNGLPLTPIRDALESKLLNKFGGFTHIEGVGGWESGNGTTLELHHEPVWIYDIATIANPQTVAELKEIAVWMKHAANQESVYVRLPNGDIIFV